MVFPETRFFLEVLLNNSTHKVGNYKLKLDLKEGIQKAIYLDGFEAGETQWLYEYLNPGDIMVDAGANCGYYSFIASGIVGNTGEVYAFEPDPKPREVLIKNISRNWIKNIIVSSLALGDKEECQDLFILPEREHLNNSTFILGHHPIGGTQKARITTLDRIFYPGIRQIDFIKIDVEGMEPNIIRGMDKLLTDKRVSYLLVELHDKALIPAGTNADKLDKLICSYGFTELKRKVYDEFYRNVLYGLVR